MGEFFSLDYVKDVGGQIDGIMHIGAHYAEEADDYKNHTKKVVWFEAHPAYARQMQARLENFQDQIGFTALLSDVSAEKVDFWITADEFASSVLKPAYHQVQNPHAPITDKITLETERFDILWPVLAVAYGLDLADYNMLVLDTQGSELKVLRGMGDFVSNFSIIQAEYSTVEFYEDGPRLQDIDSYLEGFNFSRVFPTSRNELIHGDALYVKGR